MRAEGIASPASVFAAVLETDGTITVVRNSTDGETAGMRTVAGYPPEPS
jgi:uncharacterized membrane protein YcaP (DUF421 family)